MQHFHRFKGPSGDVIVDLNRIVAIQPAQEDRCLIWVHGMGTGPINVFTSTDDLFQAIDIGGQP